MCSLLDVTSEAILGSVNRLGKYNDELKLGRNVINNQNGNIMVSYYFYPVTDVTHLKFRVRLCTCISEMSSLDCAYWSRCAK